MIEYEAVPLKSGQWAVRPKGQLGTCGFLPIPWEVIYVSAVCEEAAITKAMHLVPKPKTNYASRAKPFRRIKWDVASTLHQMCST
jgi:hypothetical protein